MKRNFKMKIPSDAKRIMRLLKDNGYTAYVVGGCVRDSMLGKEPHDYDICTSASPDQVKDLLAKKGYKTYDTGLKHGTVSVMGDSELYEITTYRIDGDYTDGRHPDLVEFVDDVKQDLSRRDFTINAMAYNTSGLVDPFDGKTDLQHRLIRCVGSPDVRFHEDALRILRALRFAAKYGFTIEEETKRSIHRNVDLLKLISRERKKSEFEQFLLYANAELMMEFFDVIEKVVPKFHHVVRFDRLHQQFNTLEQMARTIESLPNTLSLRLPAFFSVMGYPNSLSGFVPHGDEPILKDWSRESALITKDVMTTMRFENAVIEETCVVIAGLNYPTEKLVHKANIKNLLRDINIDLFNKLMVVQAALWKQNEQALVDGRCLSCDAETEVALLNTRIACCSKAELLAAKIVADKEPYQIKHLQVNGYDIQQLGANGKEIGFVLTGLLDTVIREPELNEKKTLMKLAKNDLKMLRSLQDEGFSIQ